VLGEERVEKTGIAGLDDALFILSAALEDHPDSHRTPGVDIPAAAQYVIHCGDVLFEVCIKGFVPTLSPLLFV